MAFRKLSTATKRGDQLDQLRTMAAILAKQIDICESGRDLAALSRQYRDTVMQIKEMEENEVDRENDDIAQILKKRTDSGKPGAIRDMTRRPAAG